MAEEPPHMKMGFPFGIAGVDTGKVRGRVRLRPRVEKCAEWCLGCKSCGSEQSCRQSDTRFVSIYSYYLSFSLFASQNKFEKKEKGNMYSNALPRINNHNSAVPPYIAAPPVVQIFVPLTTLSPRSLASRLSHSLYQPGNGASDHSRVFQG
jgi:hypothetical protein